MTCPQQDIFFSLIFSRINFPVVLLIHLIFTEEFLIYSSSKKKFRCFKFISDEANENAKSDWVEKCKKGAVLFSEHAKNLSLI